MQRGLQGETALKEVSSQQRRTLVRGFVGCGLKPNSVASSNNYLCTSTSTVYHETHTPSFHATHTHTPGSVQDLDPSRRPSIESEVEEQPPSLWRRLPFRLPCPHFHFQGQEKMTTMAERWPKPSKPAGKTCGEALPTCPLSCVGNFSGCRRPNYATPEMIHVTPQILRFWRLKQTHPTLGNALWQAAREAPSALDAGEKFQRGCMVECVACARRRRKTSDVCKAIRPRPCFRHHPAARSCAFVVCACLCPLSSRGDSVAY